MRQRSLLPSIGYTSRRSPGVLKRLDGAQRPNVRFGSLADIRSEMRGVRFTPQSRRWLNTLFGVVLDTVDRAVDRVSLHQSRVPPARECRALMSCALYRPAD
jgi:hypothetical protein